MRLTRSKSSDPRHFLAHGDVHALQLPHQYTRCEGVHEGVAIGRVAISTPRRARVRAHPKPGAVRVLGDVAAFLADHGRRPVRRVDEAFLKESGRPVRHDRVLLHLPETYPTIFRPTFGGLTGKDLLWPGAATVPLVHDHV